MTRAFAVVERSCILAEVLDLLNIFFEERLLVDDEEGVQRDVIEREDCHSSYA